ncbi:MAG TPA: histidine phosphatase family protein [Phycisphaerae bacterium]|jgi:phosphohistidine phosphatase SixA
MKRLECAGVLAAFLWFTTLAGCASDLRDSRAVSLSAPATTHAIAAGKPFINAHAIIILRHADIDPAQKAKMGNAAPLLPRGEERAKEIVTALKDAGITRIITSSALRTQATAAPLAELLGIKEDDIGTHAAENGMPSPSEADKVIAYLAASAKPDQTILLVHHHSVIPSIMADLGFEHEPEYVDATEFDRVYLVLPDPEKRTYQLFRLRFGGKW